MTSSSASPNRPPRRRRRPGGQPPPPWLMAVLSLCLFVVVAAILTKPSRPGEKPGAVAVGTGETGTPSGAPTAEPAPTTDSPAPAAQEPVQPPEQEKAADREGEATEEGSWFSDAVFIGDSRVEGLRLYSGITSEATFLDHTGLTIYEVKEGKRVIRRGDQKISVLDALADGAYGKIYIALGVNELGYFNPEGFAETCGEVVETIREKLPDARIYLQSLIPVNTAKCAANDIPYYITNEGVAAYNEALTEYFADREVVLLGIPDGLVDENGEVLEEYSADGVHFKKEGYILWLNELAAHTE